MKCSQPRYSETIQIPTVRQVSIVERAVAETLRKRVSGDLSAKKVGRESSHLGHGESAAAKWEQGSVVELASLERGVHKLKKAMLRGEIWSATVLLNESVTTNLTAIAILLPHTVGFDTIWFHPVGASKYPPWPAAVRPNRT